MAISPTEDACRPLKVVHCTWASGIGAGVARIDHLFHRFLDRHRVLPTILYLGDRSDLNVAYGDSSYFEATGSKDRFRELVRHLSDADVVQFQGGFDPLTCEAARLCGVPVIVEILHNIEPGGAFPCISCSVVISDAVLAVQPPGISLARIPNGIDLAEFPFSPKRRDEKIVILQVGSRAKSRFNLDTLADHLLPLDPRIELWICGREQVGPSSERVKFLGVVENVLPLYHQADLFVQLSDAEPFGLVALEALACGAVSALSDARAFPEIVTDGETGFLVDITSKESAVTKLRAILALYQDEGRWRAVQVAGRRLVENRYTVQNWISAYHALYDELIVRHGRRTEPAPAMITPTPEAELGDAIFHSHQEKWHEVENALLRAVTNPLPLINPSARSAALTFATLLEEMGSPELSLQLRAKATR